MAAFLKYWNFQRYIARFGRKYLSDKRNLLSEKLAANIWTNTLCIIFGGVMTFIGAHFLKMDSLKATKYETVKMNIGNISEVTEQTKRRNVYHRISQLNLEKNVQLTSRERQFIKFASIEYDTQLYMTPKDFLDSVTELQPRPRLKRHKLTPHNFERMRNNTPPLKDGSSHFFRNLRDNGIISYTEYLFLLSVLTETPLAFSLAFMMFDRDSNKYIDLDEFLMIHKILGGSFNEHEVDENTRLVLLHLIPEDQIESLHIRSLDDVPWWKRFFFSIKHTYRAKIKKEMSESDEELIESKMLVKSEQEETKKSTESNPPNGSSDEHPPLMTTLLTHLFGKNGENVVHFQGLSKFIDDLQREVIEVEFNAFAKGEKTISEVDFTTMLLRYTYMDKNQYDTYLERLLARMDVEEGVNFEDFCSFCRFLNHLEDFITAIRMYQTALSAIDHETLLRAVKISTGYTLSNHVVDILLTLFDDDGDGLMSYEEFISVMKDRLFRGFKSTHHTVGMKAFKKCVRKELKYK